jgi:hypothetical protein
VHRLGADGFHYLFLLFDRSLVVVGVAEDPKLAGATAVGLKDDAGEDLLALLEAQSLDVEMGHPDAPRVVRRVLAIVGVHALGHPLQ